MVAFTEKNRGRACGDRGCVAGGAWDDTFQSAQNHELGSDGPKFGAVVGDSLRSSVCSVHRVVRVCGVYDPADAAVRAPVGRAGPAILDCSLP